jgi:hypothetical protein
MGLICRKAGSPGCCEKPIGKSWSPPERYSSLLQADLVRRGRGGCRRAPARGICKKGSATTKTPLPENETRFSGEVYRLRYESRNRRPSEARQRKLGGTSKLDSANHDAALHVPQQWILAQTAEPCGCDGAKLLRVQFHQDSSHAEDESGMAAGVTDRLWDVNDLGVPLEAYERRAERAA